MEASGAGQNVVETVGQRLVYSRLGRYGLELADRIDFAKRSRIIGHYGMTLIERFDSDPEARMIDRYGLDASVRRGDSEPTTWGAVLAARAAFCPAHETTAAEDARFNRQLLADGGTRLGIRDRLLFFLDQHTKMR